MLAAASLARRWWWSPGREERGAEERPALAAEKEREVPVPVPVPSAASLRARQVLAAEEVAGEERRTPALGLGAGSSSAC